MKPALRNAKCPCCRHMVDASIVRGDVVCTDGIVRWYNYVEPENLGSSWGSQLHEELPTLLEWLRECKKDNDRDEIQCMAVNVAVWRLHNRRDRTPYTVVRDGGDLCIKITEAEIAEIIDEANRVIEED